MLPYGMLTELCMHCDVTLAYKQLLCRPVYATPLAPRPASDGRRGAPPNGDPPLTTTH